MACVCFDSVFCQTEEFSHRQDHVNNCSEALVAPPPSQTNVETVGMLSFVRVIYCQSWSLVKQTAGPLLVTPGFSAEQMQKSFQLPYLAMRLPSENETCV